MKHRIILAALFIIMIGGSALAQNFTPRTELFGKKALDVSKQPRNRSIRVVQASNWELAVEFTNSVKGFSLNFSNVTSVTTVYFVSPSASVTVTGKVENAAQGKVQIPFTPANLNTNGKFAARLVVADSTQTMAFLYFELEIIADPNAADLPALSVGTNINWASFSNYSNTADSGPYRAGNNISFSLNADGSVDIDGQPDTTNAASINADFASPTNYTPGAVDLASHLRGIDATLHTKYTDADATNAISTNSLTYAGGTTQDFDVVEATHFSGQWFTSVTIIASSVITTSFDAIEISSTNDVILTSAPHFTLGNPAGSQRLWMFNAGNFQIEFQDNSVLTGTRFENGGINRVLNPMASMVLFWHPGTNVWHLGGIVTPEAEGSANLLNVRNVSGSSIAEGSPVAITGFTANRPTVALADTTTGPSIGLLLTTLGNNANGQVVTQGEIANLDTSSDGALIEGTSTAGVDLFVNTNSATQPLTVTAPTAATDARQKVGQVLRVQGSSGKILVYAVGRPADESNQITLRNNMNAEKNSLTNVASITGGTTNGLFFGETSITSSIPIEIRNGGNVMPLFDSAGVQRGNLFIDSTQFTLQSFGSGTELVLSSTANLVLSSAAGVVKIDSTDFQFRDGQFFLRLAAITSTVPYTMKAELSLSDTNKIVDVADPTDPQDAATLNFVTNFIPRVFQVGIQDPTNSLIYWRKNPWLKDVTISRLFFQSEGMTGRVQVVTRSETTVMGTSFNVDTGNDVDANGQADTSFDGITTWSNRAWIGFIPTGLSAFVFTNMLHCVVEVTP